ncbi:MAG: ABC transporter permease [Alphaproteobacteria bacterium]|nr:ABC transporter permease [Alphaproteobacteria bacterium]
MGALTRVLAGRLAQAVMVALLVGIASFAIVEMLPGDQAFRIAAARYGEDLASARAAATVRAELGLDRPWPARLAVWLGQIATLDLGVSLVSGEDVIEELSLQLGATVGLSLLALGLSALVGVPLGIAMAMRGGALDAAGLVVAAALRATPAYLIGLGLMLLIAVQWGLLPAAGYDNAAAWPLPAATLAIGLAAMSMRVTREAAARVLARADTHFARTKGLAEGAVLRRHVLRNAAVPVVAYMGVQLVWLVEGVVVVESLFAWPGIGHALVHAVVARDVPMIQGTALAMGLIFVALNAAVDALCLALDPRGRRE